MAQASGLRLVDPAQRDPLRATSRGTGELIAAAIREGARRVIVGVGGSASTDGGLAAVEALGWSLHHVPVTVACDVTTPFVEAAKRFAPQKGATNAQVALLTRRLEQLADQYEARTGVDVRALHRCGRGRRARRWARGARARRSSPASRSSPARPGLDDALADDVDLVVTGEGKLDATSFLGKTVGGVLEWATDDEVPHVAVIAGQVTADAREEAQVLPNLQVLALTDRVWQGGEAFARAATLVEEAAYEAATAALADRSTPRLTRSTSCRRVTLGRVRQTPSTTMKLPVAAPARTARAWRYSGESYQRAGGVGVGELEHDEPAGRAITLQHLGRAAADDVAPAVLLDAGRRERAVLVVAVGIGHVDVDEHVRSHGRSCRPEIASLGANGRSDAISGRMAWVRRRCRCRRRGRRRELRAVRGDRTASAGARGSRPGPAPAAGPRRSAPARRGAGRRGRRRAGAR